MSKGGEIMNQGSQVDGISWEVYEVEDTSFASAKRFTYHIVVDDPVTPEQIKNIGEQVIEKAKDETPFNALSIAFYDYSEYVGGGYVLAQAEVAPGGEWSNAVNVKTGDYSEMEATWDIKEKDWDKRLTPREVEIWDRWDELGVKNPGMTEEEIEEKVAVEFDITSEELDSITTKKLTWTFQDLSE